MEQFSRLIEFRQAIYDHGLTRARDSQFELLDALLLSPPIRSFPELTLSPVFRYKWPSAYAAIETGRQDREWLEAYLSQQVPTRGPQVFPLDGTAWPHPKAKTLADRQYVHSPTGAVDGGSIVVGHAYSVLAWVPEPGRSWAPPLSIRRIPSHHTELDVGVAQVKALCHNRPREVGPCLYVIVADGKYGNHRFLGALKEEPCAIIARLRRDRVLCGEPGPYSGHGRPRVHGDRFAFKEPETWHQPDAMEALEHERWGQVRLRRWDHLHALQDATTRFSVILAEAHPERERPSRPLWLAYQPPAGQAREDQRLVDLWTWYQYRWPVEPSNRFRKQYLHWTLPRFQEPERCDRWTMLVSLAQWQLLLARDAAEDSPLPWQRAQEQLTPERVLQSLGGLFRHIDTPVAAPKTRGKAPGWPQGRPRTRRTHHRVVKKGTKKAKTG